MRVVEHGDSIVVFHDDGRVEIKADERAGMERVVFPAATTGFFEYYDKDGHKHFVYSDGDVVVLSPGKAEIRDIIDIIDDPIFRGMMRKHGLDSQELIEEYYARKIAEAIKA